MKKSKKKIILILVLLLLLSLVFIIGKGSFSKYLTQVEGQGIIEVAGWSFLVNGNDSNFTRINLGETTDNGTVINKKMMPGSRGVFNIVIDATGSDVDVEYNVEFLNETKKPKNVIFQYDTYKVNSIKELNQYLSGTISANEEYKKRIITVDWIWPLDSNDDIQDTEDGKNIEEYSFDIKAYGRQVISNT